jgi:alkylhydroperoxidase family enzyme
LTAPAGPVTVTPVGIESDLPPPSPAIDRSAGIEALRRWAPDAASAFTDLRAEVWLSSSPGRLVLADARIAQLLRDEPGEGDAPTAPTEWSARLAEVSRWPSSPRFGEGDRACLGFSEQFVVDVAGVDDPLRADLNAALGPAGVLDFVVALFVLDHGRRVTMVLDRLFPDGAGGFRVAGGADTVGGAAGGADPVSRSPSRGDGSEGMALLGTFDRLSRSVALLDAVDPVTTELVRLRSAREHNCRLCQSTRSVRALDAGADEALLGATERYEVSDLSEGQKVALRLTDAMITRPAAVDAALAEQVHRSFAPPQVVELVMDVMRNSGQKIAVALAADAPHVTSGVERFEISPAGEVRYLG